MKKRVFVTRRIPEIGINLLKQRNDIELDIYDDDEKIPRRKLLKRVRGAHVILSILTENIDAEVMNAAGDQLEMIANYAVGFNNIDVKEAKKRSIAVSNAPGPEIVESVAEHTVALILALSHRIVEGDRFMRGGKYSAWGPLLLLGNDLCGKTLGIIGTGRIGEGVAKALHLGFGVNILYHDLERNKKLEKSCKAKYRTKETLLKQADIVSLHVPLLPATRHLISKKELKMMKETAILINTARGPVVDEAALLDALVNGSIAGAGLDVYECEPHLGCSMYARKLFRKLPNVVVTPHTASATKETRSAMSLVAAKNIIAHLDGKKLPNSV